MRYLIDGNNFIGHSRDMNLEDEQCRGEAIARVVRFCRQTRSKATIIFDGGPDGYVGEDGLWLGPVRAAIAGQRRDADSRILSIMDRTVDRPGMVVVSSDRAIYGKAQTMGFVALRIHEFRRRMGEAEAAVHKAEESERELEAKNRELSEGEVEEWLEIFNQQTREESNS